MQFFAIGISGQMHEEVLVGESGSSLSPVRLWWVRCPKRSGRAGIDKSIPYQSTKTEYRVAISVDHSESTQLGLLYQTKHITTLAGWIAFRLTGKSTLVIGDASIMFPIDQTALDYNEHMLQLFDELNINSKVGPLKSLLPKVIRAGDNAGVLSQVGAGGGCL
jgi:sugar (pentulose or hexulose) kinase